MNELVPQQNNTKDDLQLLANEIIQNPNKLQEIIQATSKELENAKTNANEIANRSFLKRLFSSNTKDFANILVAQNGIMSNFFLLLQVMTFLCKGNSVLLFGLMDSLDKGLDMSNEEQKNLYTFAKSYLQEAIESAKSEELRETALKKLLIHSNELKDFQDESNNSIEELSSKTKTIETDVVKLLEFQNKMEDNIKELEEENKTLKSNFKEELKVLRQQSDQSIKDLSQQTKYWVDSKEKEIEAIISSIRKRTIVFGAVAIISLIIGIVAIVIK